MLVLPTTDSKDEVCWFCPLLIVRMKCVGSAHSILSHIDLAALTAHCCASCLSTLAALLSCSHHWIGFAQLHIETFFWGVCVCVCVCVCVQCVCECACDASDISEVHMSCSLFG